MPRRPSVKPVPKRRPPKQAARPALKPPPRTLPKQHRGGR